MDGGELLGGYLRAWEVIIAVEAKRCWGRREGFCVGTWQAGRRERERCGVLLWDVGTGREVGKWEDDTAKWTGRLIRAGN